MLEKITAEKIAAAAGRVADSTANGAAMAVYALICLALGWAALAAFARVAAASGPRVSPGDAGAAAIVGLALLGWIFQFAALASALTPPVVWLVLAAAVAASLASRVLPGIGDLRAAWRDLRAAWPRSGMAALVAALVVLLALTMLPPAFGPASGDAAAFYLAQPALIAATGAFDILPAYESFALLGLPAEMNYAALMVLAGQTAARALPLAAGAICAGLLWEIARRAGASRCAAGLTLALLATSTAFTNVAIDGKVDLFGTAMGLAAILWVMRAGEAQGRARAAYYALGGAGAGLAIGFKLSLLPVLVPMLAALTIAQIVAAERAAGRLRATIVAAAAAAFGAVLALVPLMAKNAIAFGQPFAPFLILGGGPGFALDQVWFSPDNTRWIVMSYPLALVFGRYPMQYGTMSWMWLAAIPFALAFLPAMPGALRRLTLAAAIGVAAWIAVRPSVLAPRYILPVLLALLPFAAYGIDALLERARWRALGTACLIALAGAAGLGIVRAAPPVWGSAYFHWKGPDDFPNGVWMAISTVNREAPPDARVFLGTYYSSMLRPDLLACLIKPVEADTLLAARDPAAFWAGLAAAGVTHLVVERATHAASFDGRLNPAAAIAPLHVRHAEILGSHDVYALTSGGAPVTPTRPIPAPCGHVSSGRRS